MGSNNTNEIKPKPSIKMQKQKKFENKDINKKEQIESK
jgi:hypothetical protein